MTLLNELADKFTTDVHITEEDQQIINEANTAYDDIVSMLEELEELREILPERKCSEKELAAINGVLDEMVSEIPLNEYEAMLEKVDRQFRRYTGQDTLKRQYRCTTGPKAGRIVTSPEKCGIRKDPRRVRLGKKAARMKKGQRVRKTLFTKRKTTSKRLSRLNKVLRGDN